jgi:hypothetical protein
MIIVYIILGWWFILTIWALIAEVIRRAYINGYCDATEAIYGEQANETVKQLRNLK